MIAFIREKLFSLSDAKFKAFSEKLTPGDNNIIGVKVPLIKELAKQLANSGECEEFLNYPDLIYHEEKLLYGLLLGYRKFDSIQTLLKYFDIWLEYVNNWAICDSTVMNLKVFKKYKNEVLAYFNLKLTQSDDTYVLRAVVVSLFSYFLDSHMTEVLTIFSNINSGDYYVEMALAWGLSVILIKNFERGISFLKENKVSAWVHNKAIQKATESYRISREQKDYLISQKKDVSLKKNKFDEFLPNNLKGYNFRIFDEITSTNTYLKNIPKAKKFRDTLIAAQKQSEGKGRMNRSFYSPDKHGLYASLLLNPDKLPNCNDLTAVTAVAVMLSLEELGIKNLNIKWVNDLYLYDRKVCGILAESAFDTESRRMNYIVVGFGINISKPIANYPQEIANKVGFIFEKTEPTYFKEKLLAGIVKHFYSLLEDKDRVLETYRNKSYLTGKEITVIKTDSECDAKAESIAENFGLMVTYSDGTKEILTSGEVSVKIK